MDGGVPADDEVTFPNRTWWGTWRARLASRVYDDALERGVDRAG